MGPMASWVSDPVNPRNGPNPVCLYPQSQDYGSSEHALHLTPYKTLPFGVVQSICFQIDGPTRDLDLVLNNEYHDSQNNSTGSSPLTSVASDCIGNNKLPSQVTQSSTSTIKSNLDWGSDESFGPDGYSPNPSSPTLDDVEDDLTDIDVNFVQPLPYCQQGVYKKGARNPRRGLLHMLSERGKRTEQKLLYDEISELIPSDPSDRKTKGQLLKRTSAWLEEFLDGNARLRSELQELQSSGMT